MAEDNHFLGPAGYTLDSTALDTIGLCHDGTWLKGLKGRPTGNIVVDVCYRLPGLEEDVAFFRQQREASHLQSS